MAASVLMSCALLLCAAFPLASGQSSFCNLAVASENGRDCVCPDAKLYDYSKQDCVDQAVLYTYNECGPNADVDNCDCIAGWKKDPDTGLCTEVNPLCADETCKADEMCMDLPGRSYCRCEDYKYRFSDDQCNSMDESVNPQWYDCPQGYNDISAGYACFCITPAFVDESGDGKTCAINSAGGYEDCSTEVLVCATKDGEVVVNNTRAGYDENGNDIDECATLDTTYCWAHSQCVNLDGGQGYLCQCDSGYTDQYFDTPIKECVLEQEPYCTGCACEDSCGGTTQCSNGTFCSATSACSVSCAASLQETALQSPEDVALYTGFVVVALPQFNYHVNHMTLSLEAIVGRQDVQVLSEGNDNFTFVVTTQSDHMAGLSEDEVRGVIAGACLPFKDSDFCQLPGGVVTANDSISVYIKPSCTEASCPYNEYDCFDLQNGRYQCKCPSEEGTGEYLYNVIEICTDGNNGSTTTTTKSTLATTTGSSVISTKTSAATSTPSTTTTTATTNPQQSTTLDYEQMAEDLQKQLDDTKHSKTVTAAVLGTLLFVALVALVVLGFFYLKK